MKIKVGVLGACGRMGRAIIAELATRADAALAAAAEYADHPRIGEQFHGITVVSDLDAAMRASDVVIDFSSAAALRPHLDCARANKTPIVIGTTGLEPHHFEAMTAAARDVPLLYSANMSVGVTLLAALVEQVSAQLQDDWDIEIVEMHHRHKVDAPSGTALLLGRAAAAGRGIYLSEAAVRGRDGITGARFPGSIGFAALRGGSVPGDHTVIFATEHERLELTHRAESRDIFARGALRAALWLFAQPPGHYALKDMLLNRASAD